MTTGDLMRLYFERSTALQWYWTIYVLVIGGLLAFSSLRQRGDLLTVILITALYCCFAYKNLGAIREVTEQRLAVIKLINVAQPVGPAMSDPQQVRDVLLPTLSAPDYAGVRNFHVVSDLLTLAAVWGMERRRRRSADNAQRSPGAPPKSSRDVP